MVDNNINWRIYYYIQGVLCLIITAIYLIFSVENPRFYGVYRDFANFRASIIYIKEFNNPEGLKLTSNNDEIEEKTDIDSRELRKHNNESNKRKENKKSESVSKYSKSEFSDNVEGSNKQKEKTSSIYESSNSESSILPPYTTDEEFEKYIEQVFYKIASKDLEADTDESDSQQETELKENTERIKDLEDKKNSGDALLEETEKADKSLDDSGSIKEEKHSNNIENQPEKKEKMNNQVHLPVEKTDKSDLLVMKDPWKNQTFWQRCSNFTKRTCSKLNNKTFYVIASIVTLEESYIYLTSLEVKQYNNEMRSVFYIFAAVNLLTIAGVSKLMNVKGIGRKGTLYLIALGIFCTILVKIIYEIFTFEKNSTLMIALYLIKRNFVWNLLCPVHTFANESFSSKNRVLLYGLGYSFSKAISQLMPFVYEYGMEYLDQIGWGISVLLALAVYQAEETAGKQLVDI